MSTLDQLTPETVAGFSLYHYDSCPFCVMTRRVIDQTSLDIELRNIQMEPQHRADLIKNGGKSTVPCLRIDMKDGRSGWLYESSDIMHFVRDYADKHQAA